VSAHVNVRDGDDPCLSPQKPTKSGSFIYLFLNRKYYD
jgi:hypothetical protein